MNIEAMPGMSKLGGVISDRIGNQSASGLVLDYGEIQANYGLKTNTFPKVIPKSDYTVCRSISGISTDIGGLLPKVKPGDHVLVAWVKNDVTVIDVIVPAKQL